METDSSYEKIKVVVTDDGVEIMGNRKGLQDLAQMCIRLAELPEDDAEARRLGNHVHYSPDMNTAEEGSVPLIILYKPDL